MGSMFQGLIDWFFNALKGILIAVLSLLPDSPFNLIDNTVIGQYLNYINWIIPMNQIIAILELWVVAIAIFYVYQAIMRWVKAID